MRTRLQFRPGLHELEIWVQEGALPGAALLWKRPGDEDFLPVEVSHLYHGSIAPDG